MAQRCRNATGRRSSSVKLAATLATCTKRQRSVIRFLNIEGVKPIEIHRRMKVKYGDPCLSLQQVYEWSRKFMNGIGSVTGSPRPGSAHRVVTPEAIAAVEAIVKENRRVTVNEKAAHLDMSHGSAHHIFHDVLQFHKVSARWVPRQLTAELKEGRVDACQELMKRFEAEDDGFLGKLLRELKSGSSTTSRKPRKLGRNGAIPSHQNQKNSAHDHLRERLF